MRYLLPFLVLGGSLIAGRIPTARGMDGNQDPDANVNSRYTVESIDLKGRAAKRLNQAMRTELNRLVGQKLDPSKLAKYAEMLQKELHAKISVRVEKGTQQGSVVVAFEAEHVKKTDFEISASKFNYHSSEGWSGTGVATVRTGDNAFQFGLVNDGDALIERFAGIRAGYQRRSLFSDRASFRFDYTTYRAQWNQATLGALAAPTGPRGIYRTRESFAPIVTIALAKPLSLTAGVDFVRLQTQYPSAKSESANAALSSLRYAQRWGDSGHVLKDEDAEFYTELSADYSIRAANRSLDSDFVYTRHTFGSRFTWARGANKLIARFTGGLANGRAPLFERFSAGDTQTLRGWNKFDLAPKGGDRLTTGTLEYRYKVWMVFYDTGAVWDRGSSPSQKHGVGGGLRFKGFQVAMAFPLRDAHITPVFLVGTTF